MFFDLITKNKDLDKTAFEDELGNSLSYRKLHEISNQLGIQLNQLFGKENLPIVLYQSKGINTVLSIYSCVKAGFAFIVVDPDNTPLERLKFYFKATGSKIIISEGVTDSVENYFKESDLTHIEYQNKSFVDTKLYDIPNRKNGEFRSLQQMGLAKNKISHIIFTSGTTGQPKGVLIKEFSQVSFVKEMAKVFNSDFNTKWLSVCPFYFDVFTLDLFVQPYCGSLIHLVSSTIQPTKLAEAIEIKKITQLLLISSQVKMLASRFSGFQKRDYSSLKELWYGGEACPIPTLTKLKTHLPNLQFAQLYGPSEVCNNSTIFKFNDIGNEYDGYMPLGKTIDSVVGYVVDENGEKIDSGLGELYLGGSQVMEGYIGDLEKSRKILIDNPFNPNDKYKLYKTGDYVFIKDNILQFKGRKDDLIKLRGNRVSLYEIQEQLVSIKEILDAVVFVNKDDEYLDSLIAIIITENEIKIDLVKKEMINRLPKNYIPDTYISVLKSEIPLNKNGKLDRNKIIEYYEKGQSRHQKKIN